MDNLQNATFNRRTFLKATCLAALATTTTYAYDKKLISNTTDVKIKDPKNPTPFELKHLPDITIGDKDAKGFTKVEVSVGQENIIHPSVANHWIYEIVLYADGTKVAQADLEPVISRGYLSARVNLKDIKELTAIAKCNLHGNYTATKAV